MIYICQIIILPGEQLGTVLLLLDGASLSVREPTDDGDVEERGSAAGAIDADRRSPRPVGARWTACGGRYVVA
jgi:hypothetical protein